MRKRLVCHRNYFVEKLRDVVDAIVDDHQAFVFVFGEFFHFGQGENFRFGHGRFLVERIDLEENRSKINFVVLSFVLFFTFEKQ